MGTSWKRRRRNILTNYTNILGAEGSAKVYGNADQQNGNETLDKKRKQEFHERICTSLMDQDLREAVQEKSASRRIRLEKINAIFSSWSITGMESKRILDQVVGHMNSVT